MQFRSIVATCLIVSVPPLTGCTPEKAEALLTAIKAFESKSNQALDAYEQLFKEYTALKKESQDELFAQAYSAAGTTSASFDDAVSIVSQFESKKANTRIENEFLQLRAAYSMLSSTYESLPQGSLIGAQHVSCGQTAVAKLTKQLVNFSSNIDQSPLYPIAVRQDFVDFKTLAGEGDAKKETAKQKFDAFYSGVAEYERKHNDAIAKTLAAVEQGKTLNQLLAKYDAVTVSNILGVIQYGFTFTSTLNGINISKSSARLKEVKDDMEKNDYWRRVESIPLASIAHCKIQPADKER